MEECEEQEERIEPPIPDLHDMDTIDPNGILDELE
jgi:hypothetical protein